MNEPVDHPHLADETLSLHLDGALDPSRTSAVAEHLSACASCAARNDALAAASGALRAALAEAPSELDARRLIERALEQHGSEASTGRGRPRSPAIAALAAVALAVLVATGLLSYDRPPAGEPAAGDARSGAAGAALPPEAFLGDLGDLDALTDAGSLGFLDQAGPAAVAPKRALPMTDPAGDVGATTTAAATELASDGETPGAASDGFAGTAPDREASPEEMADILQCAETIELSARSSGSLTEGEVDQPLSWRLELAATGRLQGSAALFLAFERPGGGLQIFLVRRDDCSIVRFLTSPLARP